MKNLVLAILFPISAFAQQNFNYKNLVLEGGGTRGLAYAGVFSVLEEKGILNKIENIGGSSAGAIAGMLISVGYSAEEIDSIMIDLPIQKFNDGKLGVVGKYRRFKSKYGIYKGEFFEKWLQQLVAFKTGNPLLTFKELNKLRQANTLYKNLYCTGTNISKQQLEIFCFNNTPNLPIATAVRISSGVPLYFEPIALNDNYQPIDLKNESEFMNYYVDGGMLCNYPICMFDSCIDKNGNPLISNNVKFNYQTIGIKLESPQQIDSLNNNNTAIPSYNINSFNTYIDAFSNLLLEALSRKYPALENEKNRTIYVNQGNISACVKKTKQQDKLLLFENGVSAANDFFDRAN